MRMVGFIRAQHIVVTDWVGNIDKMPKRAFSIHLDAKGCMDMNANLPQMRSDNDLLLTSPNTEIERLRNVCRVTVDWVLGPQMHP